MVKIGVHLFTEVITKLKPGYRFLKHRIYVVNRCHVICEWTISYH